MLTVRHYRLGWDQRTDSSRDYISSWDRRDACDPSENPIKQVIGDRNGRIRNVDSLAPAVDRYRYAGDDRRHNSRRGEIS